MKFFFLSLVFYFILLAPTSQAEDNLPSPQPPIEAYGELPSYRSISLSPSGDKLAFIRRLEGRDILHVFSADQGLRRVADLTSLHGNWIWFASEEHVIIRGYDTVRVPGYLGEVDYSGAFSYNLKTGKAKQLLQRTRNLYPAQSGLGRVIGRLEHSNDVLMPAYTGKNDRDVSRSVFKVNLNKSRGYEFTEGNRHTIDWLISPDGIVLAREDMDSRRNIYRIFSEEGGKKRFIFEQVDAARPPFNVIGVKSDKSALILSADEGSEAKFYQMNFEGVMEPMTIGDDQKGIEKFFIDKNSIIHGVQYAGMTPSYFFYDSAINDKIETLVSRFKGSAIEIIDHSDDWSKVLLHIFDQTTSGRYVLMDLISGELSGLVYSRPDITGEALGRVKVIEYEARDGLKIPAILTSPPGLSEAQIRDLPLIVMPHGGPRTYDAVQFDWMAQYFANRGYLVLQPNFRGSSGFTETFMLAGNGEWGGKMQDDITDGLNALFDNDMADRERVCIVGWSYGGYAALAGGAFTPELYDCVVAVAPVSDLERMFSDLSRDRGKSHYSLDYWREMIGDPKGQKEELALKSPINFAESFRAPVLLIHGKDDSVVDYQHSKKMERALKQANKTVQLYVIKEGGHSLVNSENRLEALKAISDFVEATIGNRE